MSHITFKLAAVIEHQPYVITPSQRIAQLVIHPITLPTVEEVNELPHTQRGTNGHGSSGA